MALRWLKDAILRRGVTPGLVKPLTHPGLRLPLGDPPGAPHVFRQLAHGEHSRCLRAGEAQRGCGDLGPGSAEGPQPEPRARQGTQGGLEPPGLGGRAPATSSGPNRKGRGGIPHGTLRERAIDSLMVIGGAGTRGHTSEGQGPVSRHPGPPPLGGGGGQTHRQRRPVQNPPAECRRRGCGVRMATGGF